MRIAPALTRAGAGLALALAAVSCGDDPTVPGRTPRPSAARDIGDSNTVFGWAEDINASGTVVGWRSTTDGDPRYTPFLWTESGGMTNLGRLPGDTWDAAAVAINDRGEVVGISQSRPFLWTASGGMRGLGMPAGAVFAVPMDISEDGHVAGAWQGADRRQHPVVWTREGGMRELPLPSHIASAVAEGVNSRGEVVGSGCPAPCDVQSPSHALFWPATGAPLDLGVRLGLWDSRAVGITDAGVVAGTLRRRQDSAYVAFTWSASAGLRNLGRFPGAPSSFAAAIGEGGHVVGHSGGRPFDWTAGDGMRDLGTLPGNPTTVHAQATGVDRSGQAAGTIYTGRGPRPVLFVSLSAP